jgi:1-acyl-sn-glycerol-3-phosphate acyltransferase
MGWTVFLIPVQMVAILLNLPFARVIPMIYHRGCLFLFGISVLIRGRPVRGTSILFVANHCGYIDISIMGAQVPCVFIAKMEISQWPFFGILARLQRTIFVNRQDYLRAGTQRDILRNRLVAGENLVLFPEGTSSDGNRAMEFKSSLFSAAVPGPGEVPVVLQPVTIAYTRLDGFPMGRTMRPYCAWYGDVGLVPHMWQLLGLGKVSIEVEFHDFITVTHESKRKELATKCHHIISSGLSEALSGRSPKPANLDSPPLSASFS